MSDIRYDPLDALRRSDRERYSALLYTPEQVRADLATLHLFDLELARIPALVTEPMAGEIRLQWWREVLSGERTGEGRASPLANALLDTVERHRLPANGFGMMLDGRIADLYDDTFRTRTDLEAYSGQTRSALFQLLLQVVDEHSLPNSADASGHAGCAWAIGQILRSTAMDRARGRVRIPDDLLAGAGGEAADWLRAEDDEFLRRATDAFIALGETHLAAARVAIGDLPMAARGVYLPLVATRLVLKQARKAGPDVAREPVRLPPLRYQFALLQSMFRSWKIDI